MPWLWWWWLRHCRRRWMESIWLLCNEKSTPTTLNPYDAADDHEGSPCIWWTNQLFLPLKMQSMIGVTSQSWDRKNMDLPWGTDWKVKHLSAKDYWTEICWETPTMVWAISKDSCDLIWIKGAQNVFLQPFMQFMKCNRGTMDLQKWMTRFQLTGNRLIEFWMDLLPDLLTTSPEAIAFVAQRRQEHEERQAELAGAAEALPGQEPHVNIPWTDEHALAAFKQVNGKKSTTDNGFSLGWQVLRHWELLIHIMIERISIWGLLLWRGKEFGGYLNEPWLEQRNVSTSLEEEAEVLVSVDLLSERTYLATTPQLTPEIIEELLEHFMDPVDGSNAKGRKPIGMCCLHVDGLFITGTPEFLETFKKVVESQFKIGHEDVNDLMFTGQRVKWIIDEKT